MEHPLQSLCHTPTWFRALYPSKKILNGNITGKTLAAVCCRGFSTSPCLGELNETHGQRVPFPGDAPGKSLPGLSSVLARTQGIIWAAERSPRGSGSSALPPNLLGSRSCRGAGPCPAAGAAEPRPASQLQSQPDLGGDSLSCVIVIFTALQSCFSSPALICAPSAQLSCLELQEHGLILH